MRNCKIMKIIKLGTKQQLLKLDKIPKPHELIGYSLNWIYNKLNWHIKGYMGA